LRAISKAGATLVHAVGTFCACLLAK